MLREEQHSGGWPGTDLRDGPRAEGIIGLQNKDVRFQIERHHDLNLCPLFLALRAVMTTASANDDAFDQCLANEARLAFPAVNAMLNLKKAFVSVGINVISDTRAPEPNGFF